MTKPEAKDIIEKCHGWDTGQTSKSVKDGGPRTSEDDVLDEKRQTLAVAWRTLREEA